MKKAFSLVELSIVLVILGLLVGGILAGQSLIRASELRAVSAEYQRYTTAMHAFRDKYFALPGDITNATRFWQTAAACPGTPSTPSTTAATCDGDGDGTVDWDNGASNEIFRFWQHLANAGLIEGTYSSVTGGTNNAYTAIIGTNVPRSKLSGAGWTILNRGVRDVSNTFMFEGDYTNSMVFDAQIVDDGSFGAILKPEEAWNIDTKMDDGRPGKGNTRVPESFTTCHDAGTSATVAIGSTANYALATTTATCSLIFKPI